MTINIERRGGFAGLTEKLASAELQSLPKGVADQVRAHLASLTTLASQRRESVGADQLQYSVEIDDPAGKRQTFTITDEGNPSDPAIQSIEAIVDLVGKAPH